MVICLTKSTYAFNGTNVTLKVIGERSDIRTTTPNPANPVTLLLVQGNQ
jgi:hypothetical protein